MIVAYLYREMGIVSKAKAERATYIAVMLFFLTAVIGVGHNFYWIAKPTGVIALGSVFSTTQVFPLILLTLDAWKHTQIEELAEEAGRLASSSLSWGRSCSSSWAPISGTCSVQVPWAQRPQGGSGHS